MPKFLQASAASRTFDLDDLAFALGTALAFSIVYFLVAQNTQKRSDAWLSGEAEVLARVSADTPRDRLYDRIVREVAELATQELPDNPQCTRAKAELRFFLDTDPKNNESPLWVGPGSDDIFSRQFSAPTLFPVFRSL